MAVFETWLKNDLKKPLNVEYLNGNIFSQDNQGNLIGVEVFDDGEEATLSGSVSANIIRADGSTVAQSGTLSGNKCSIVLPQAAYAVPGILTIVIKLTTSGVITTVAAAVATVYRSSTDTIVDPGTIIPSVQALISQIETAIASIPADYSSLLADLAPSYSQKAWHVGEYCWHDGDLKRCKTEITTAESYNSAHWESAVFGVDLYNESVARKQADNDLKSAMNTEFQDELGTVLCDGWVAKKYIDTSGDTVDITNPSSNSNYSYLVIPCTSGDIFKIDVSGASSSWPYVFINTNGGKLNTQPSNNQYGVTITAPENSVYLVCNTKNNHKKVYKGASRMSAVEGNIAQNTADIGFLFNTNAQVVVDSLPVIAETDFETGTIDHHSGEDAGSQYAIRTKKYYIVRGCSIEFTGVMDDDRYCFVYYFDKDLTYVSYQQNEPYTVPATAVYARIVYGFDSESGYTVESYGFSNLFNDFGLVLKNIKVDTTDEALRLITKGELALSFTIADGKFIAYATGALSTNSAFHATGFIAIPEGTEQIETNFYNTETGTDGYAFYDATKAFVSGGKCRKSDQTIIPVPNTAKFIRLSGRKSYEETGVDRYVKAVSGTQRKANDGNTVVMIGDSIIGNYNGADSIPAYLEKFIGAKCYNCAFGGSSMGTDTQGSVNQLLLPFRGFKVIEAIVNNDYDDMDAAIEADPEYTELKAYYPEHVDMLKNMDWTKVDLITISYGINDWLLEVTVDDNPSNPKDTNTIGGAFRTALETLWATYPNIRVMICSPIWCGGTISGGELLWDTDNHQNDIHKYVIEYVEKEEQVAKEYHVPFLEMYNNTNFNRHNWKRYFPSTGSNAIHPNANGRYVMARRYAWFMSQF